MRDNHFLQRLRQTTNVRRNGPLLALLGELRRLLQSEAANAFAIGDLVNRLKTTHGLMVKQMARILGASAQRLSEFRRTAAAFPKEHRDFDVDFHFYTIASRAAGRLGLSPVEVIKDIVRRRLDSTRKATMYLARKIAARENLRSRDLAAIRAVRGGELIGRCHLADYRDVIGRLETGAVKLMIADPPYGQYGQLRDGEHTRVASTRRDCDSLRHDEAVAVTVDLFRLALPKLAQGGCMVVFRPGAIADPSWLMDAAEAHGWACRYALTWHKGSVKLADASEPYAASSERMLVFARPGDRLINHDGSERGDVIKITPVRPNYATGHDHHLFEKPLDLMRFLIKKHCYEGELVIEPFGGSGGATLAAIELNRQWLYCESNRANFELGSSRIARQLAERTARVS
jgi:hypothetical protein